MSYVVDVTPEPRGIIEAIENDEWSARGAISELVSNSFGEKRGDAQSVHIFYNAKARTLTVLDGGRGMSEVADLFHLTKTVGRSARDIGKYGMGGTMACIWLAGHVDVVALRGGSVSRVEVDWEAFKATGMWDVTVEPWTRANASNTPAALLERGHGTLVTLKIRRTRRIHEADVQEELARTFAPAIRYGKSVRWTSQRTNGNRETLLVNPQDVPSAQRWDLALDIEGKVYTAVLLAGIDPDASVDDSRIDICYGPQVIFGTKKCYTSPDGSRSYGGLSVRGYCDLGEGFQDFFTTRKGRVREDVEDILNAALFERLGPLLEQVKTEQEQILLDNLALNTAVMLEGLFDGPAEPTKQEPRYRWERADKGETVPDITVVRDPFAGRLGKSGARVWPQFVPGEKLNGLWDCRIDEGTITVLLDQDHPYIRAIRDQRSPLAEQGLASYVVQAVVAKLVDLDSEDLSEILKATVIRDLEKIDSQPGKISYLTRYLLQGAARAQGVA